MPANDCPAATADLPAPGPAALRPPRPAGRGGGRRAHPGVMIQVRRPVAGIRVVPVTGAVASFRAVPGIRPGPVTVALARIPAGRYPRLVGRPAMTASGVTPGPLRLRLPPRGAGLLARSRPGITCLTRPVGSAMGPSRRLIVLHDLPSLLTPGWLPPGASGVQPRPSRPVACGQPVSTQASRGSGPFGISGRGFARSSPLVNGNPQRAGRAHHPRRARQPRWPPGTGRCSGSRPGRRPGPAPHALRSRSR